LRIREMAHTPIDSLASRAANVVPRCASVCGSDHLSIALADRTEQIAYRLSVWTSFVLIPLVLDGIGPHLKLSYQRFNLSLLAVHF